MFPLERYIACFLCRHLKCVYFIIWLTKFYCESARDYRQFHFRHAQYVFSNSPIQIKNNKIK